MTEDRSLEQFLHDLVEEEKERHEHKRHQSPSEAIDKLSTALEMHKND